MDRQKDRQTPVKQYAPNLLMQMHKKPVNFAGFFCFRDCSDEILIKLEEEYSPSSSNIVLTHSHTMTPFDAPGKQAF